MNEIKYIKQGDYYIPDLQVGEDLRLTRLGEKYKKHFTDKYNIDIAPALYPDWLIEHFIEIDRQMCSQFEHIMNQYIEIYGIDEVLKETNPMKWAKEMNSVKMLSRESVLNNFIE